MNVHLLHREQILDLPPAEVFEFFSRPENLARITPPAMRFTILTPLPIAMKPGALIDYTVRTLGLSVRWTTLITEFDPPHRFVDVQLKGPYAFWHHTHRFEEVDHGNGRVGTRIIDEVRYALPFGPLGELARLLVVKRELEKIFDFRRRVIVGLLPPAPPIDHTRSNTPR